MALPFIKWGSTTRSAGIFSSFAKNSQIIHYGAAEKVTFSFDPFADIKKVQHIRTALWYMSNTFQRATNPNCILRTEVLSDLSQPTIHVKLLDGNELLFKTENLTTLEILENFNVLVSSKAPKKVDTGQAVLQTKAEKALKRKKQ